MPPESCLARLPVPVELAEGRVRGCVHRQRIRRAPSVQYPVPILESPLPTNCSRCRFVLCTNRHGCVPLPTQHVKALASCQTVRSATGAVGAFPFRLQCSPRLSRKTRGPVPWHRAPRAGLGAALSHRHPR